MHGRMTRIQKARSAHTLSLFGQWCWCHWASFRMTFEDHVCYWIRSRCLMLFFLAESLPQEVWFSFALSFPVIGLRLVPFSFLSHFLFLQNSYTAALKCIIEFCRDDRGGCCKLHLFNLLPCLGYFIDFASIRRQPKKNGVTAVDRSNLIWDAQANLRTIPASTLSRCKDCIINLLLIAAHQGLPIFCQSFLLQYYETSFYQK